MKIPDRKIDQWMWMTSCTGSARGGFWVFWKSQFVEFLARKKTVDFRELAEGRPVALWRVRTWWGADGKVIIERSSIYLPYVETFNSKVIKSFVPELRSRYVFFVFRDSYVLCIYVKNILCPFHTHPYIWLCNRFTLFENQHLKFRLSATFWYYLK